MVDYAPSNEPEASKRRSSRVVLSIPVTVNGVDALGQAFRERTSTLTVNCHGFKYPSKHYVLRGTWLEIEVPHPEAGQPVRRVRGKVSYVQRPRTVKELFQVGVEIAIASNIWGVAFPPDDWVPFDVPGEGELSQPPSIATEMHASESTDTAAAGSALRPVPASPTPAAWPAPAHTGEGTAMYPFSPTSAAEISANVSQQIEKMVAAAQEKIQQAAREASAAAVSREAASLLRELNEQLKTAAEKAVEQAASGYADQMTRTALQKIERSAAKSLQDLAAARENSSQELRAAWTRQFESDLHEATQQSQDQLAEVGQSFREEFSQRLSAEVAAAAERLAEIEQRLREMHEQAAADAEKTPSLLESARKEMDALAEETKKNWGKRLASYAESGLSRLSELDETARKLQERIQAASDTAQTGWRQKLEQDLAEAHARFEEMAETALEGTQHELAEHVAEAAAGAASKVAAGLDERAGAFRAMVAAAALQAEKRVTETQASLNEKLLKTEARAAEIEEATGRVREQSRQLEEMAQKSAAELVWKFEEMLAASREQLNGQAEGALAGMSQRMEKALQEQGAEMVSRVAAEVEKRVAAHLHRADRTIKKLKELEALVEETLQKEQARLQSEFEKASRSMLTNYLEELDAKSTDATHTTFEQLYKSAEWYQRKAQTSMQTAFEKGLTQATTQLREKAAEISTMFASELDYYSRSYSGHTQGLLDEAAKEMAGRMRSHLNEAMETSTAKFSDEIHRVAEEKVERLHAASGSVVEESRGRMMAQVEQVCKQLDAQAAKSATEFQQRIAERLRQGVNEAKEKFQTQIQPVQEGWRAEARAHQDQWLKTLDRKGDESVEKYKSRLENVSNSWMVAAVTSLSQHSQGVVDSLAKALELRLRETCAEVFAGVGESMRQRLLGISEDLKKNK